MFAMYSPTWILRFLTDTLEHIVELFSFVAPTWLYVVAAYIAGTFVVGYPMGYFSLKVWKEPHRTVLSFLLFPGATMEEEVGKPRRKYDASLKLITILDITQFVLLHESDDHLRLRAQYIFATMLLWPIRLLFNTVFVFIVGLVVLIAWCIATFVSQGSRTLFLCKRCLKI